MQNEENSGIRQVRTSVRTFGPPATSDSGRGTAAGPAMRRGAKVGLSMFDRKQQVGLDSAFGQTPTLKQSSEDWDQSQ